MNYLNLFIVVLIIIYILGGYHKGFLVSVGNTLGMVVSWIISYLFSPMLATSISESSFYRFLINFTEGASRLADKSLGKEVVATLSPYQITNIVDASADLVPAPFGELVESNMQGLALQGQGYTVADYFNFTVANVVVNILAFLIIYVLARVVIALVLNTVNYASPLPMLKHCDGIAGAGLGFVRGFFDMYVIAMLLPVILVSMPVDVPLFADMLAESSMATFFYENNFLLSYISGII